MLSLRLLGSLSSAGLALLVCASGCSLSHGDARDASVSDPDGGARPIDASAPTPDAGPPDAGEGLDPRLRALVCHLTDDALIRAALRGSACSGLATSAPFFAHAQANLYGEAYFYGYAGTSVTNCEITACLADASSCAEAELCMPLAYGEPCDASGTRRCVGDGLEVCAHTPASAETHWVRVQDCGLMAATCVEGATGAYCAGSDLAVDAECSPFGDSCDGDTAVRCIPGADGHQSVRVRCDGLIAGGTCAFVAIGGEAPGPMCVRDTECSPDAGGFCDPGTGALTLCVHGEEREVRCSDYGYSACEDTWPARCVP